MTLSFFKNKQSILFAFGAALFLCIATLGGEYFHEHLHHHATASSHDDCYIYQLQAQLFLFVAAILAGLFASFICDQFQPSSFIPRLALQTLRNPRAPPVSL